MARKKKSFMTPKASRRKARKRLSTTSARVKKEFTYRGFNMEQLRAASPSAENKGEPDLFGNIHGASSQTEFPGVKVIGWTPIGGYAIRFDFSDGHRTGLYSFDYLKRLAKNGGN